MRAVSEEEVSEVEAFLDVEALRSEEAEEGSLEDRNAMQDGVHSSSFIWLAITEYLGR